MATSRPLSLSTKLGYGAGDVGGNLFFTVVAFWLMNYLTDEVGLSASLAGAAVMVGKIWDAVTDPTVGYLSDRTRTRWGRRRPWFLFSAVPLGLSFLFLFNNPKIEDPTWLFVWAAFAYSLTCMVYTGVNIPYNALTPELTKDFNERTALNGYRMVFAVCGTLIGAGAAMPIVNAAATRTAGYFMMGGVFGAVMTLSALVPFLTVREPPPPTQGREGSILAAYADAFRNKPFLLILLPWASNIVGITVVTASLIYYFKYAFGREELVTPALLALLVTVMVTIPFAVKLSKKVGKKQTYIAGLALMSVTLLLFFALGHQLGLAYTFGTMVVFGIGLSTHYVLPWAIVPDTVELDYTQSGVRREGVYYGLWTFAIKIGQAAAGLLVGVALDASGYVANAAQTESALLGIRMLIGPFTAVFFIIGGVILYFYPIGAAEYAEIRAKAEAMDREQEVGDDARRDEPPESSAEPS